MKNGKPVGDMQPSHWNNRQVLWYYITAPFYKGDIKIGFLRGSMTYWTAVAITHLHNGIHSLEHQTGGQWVRAKNDGDMGQAWIVEATTKGGRDFAVRVTDVDDNYIHNGRIYKFSLPEKCGVGGCQTEDLIPVEYTTEDGAAGGGGAKTASA